MVTSKFLLVEKKVKFDPCQAQPIFSLRTDESHFDRIHSSLTVVQCFDNGYVGKQPVAWKEYCVENWLTHYQTTNFRLFQTKRVCKRQFQI